MEVIHLSYPLKERSKKPIALAIGYFDGVHLGHQAVIAKAKSLAQELDVLPAVLTFHPHPREVLGQDAITRYITPLPVKLELFEQLGIEQVFVMKFDLPFSSLTAEEFVKEVLLPLQVKGVATGFNFRFGQNALGKHADLVSLGNGVFQAEMVREIQMWGMTISSTKLRHALTEGDIYTANMILGRNYLIRGIVVQGDQMGRLLGFPTANLSFEQPFYIPKRGVYIVKVRYENDIAYGMMNIGIRPTFRNPTPQERLEVHLFEREVDLYGKELEVEFLHYLREEQKFPSKEALVNQLERDQRDAYMWLKNKYN
jgi:riboflavin kinase/FMN adenylyltransferase